MRQVAGLSLSEGSPYDAFSFFEKLKDRTGMISALMEIENSEVNHYSGLIYGSHLIDRMDKESRKWASKKGFPRYKPLFLCKSVALVDATVDNYDLAIGIAKAGLMPAYIAELFGARSRVVESHSDHIKPDKKATFRWIDKLYPSDIKGKNIIVYDKDVVTGRSSGRVLEALLDHNPARVDLGLIHDKCPLIGYGSHFENVHKGYQTVFTSGMYQKTHFVHSLERLEKALEVRR